MKPLHHDLFSDGTVNTKSISNPPIPDAPLLCSSTSLEDTPAANPTLTLTLAPLQKPIPKYGGHASDGDVPLIVINDLLLKQSLICQHMGTMAQCRGENGSKLRNAGAVEGLLQLLYSLADQRYLYLPPLSLSSLAPIPVSSTLHPSSSSDDGGTNVQTLLSVVLELASTGLAALRDLACGSMANRTAIGTFQLVNDDTVNDDETGSTGVTGIDILASFVDRYQFVTWEHILSLEDSRLELRVLTNAIGAIRNVAHSHSNNCEMIHNQGMTETLIWRLKLGGGSESMTLETEAQVQEQCPSTMPDVTKPWREAAFRIAGCIINLAERCQNVASRCATDDVLIQILIDSWGGGVGGKNSALLHIGLGNILKKRKETGDAYLDELVFTILQKEGQRADAAREKEKRRKKKTSDTRSLIYK